MFLEGWLYLYLSDKSAIVNVWFESLYVGPNCQVPWCKLLPNLSINHWYTYWIGIHGNWRPRMAYRKCWWCNTIHLRLSYWTPVLFLQKWFSIHVTLLYLVSQYHLIVGLNQLSFQFRGQLVTLFKKGETTLWVTYRDITVLSVLVSYIFRLYKVNIKIKAFNSSLWKMSECHVGFPCKYSCVDICLFYSLYSREIKIPF